MSDRLRSMILQYFWDCTTNASDRKSFWRANSRISTDRCQARCSIPVSAHNVKLLWRNLLQGSKRGNFSSGNHSKVQTFKTLTIEVCWSPTQWPVARPRKELVDQKLLHAAELRRGRFRTASTAFQGIKLSNDSEWPHSRIVMQSRFQSDTVSG